MVAAAGAWSSPQGLGGADVVSVLLGVGMVAVVDRLVSLAAGRVGSQATTRCADVAVLIGLGLALRVRQQRAALGTSPPSGA